MASQCFLSWHMTAISYSRGTLVLARLTVGHLGKSTKSACGGATGSRRRIDPLFLTESLAWVTVGGQRICQWWGGYCAFGEWKP
jgi:hypothetical protein